MGILGDPGAVSRVDKMFVVFKVYCKIARLDLTVNFHHEHFIHSTNLPLGLRGCALGSKGDYMETIMNHLPPLPSFWYILLCVDDVLSKLDIQDVKRTKAFGKFDWFCHPRFLQPNLNQMQYNI